MHRALITRAGLGCRTLYTSVTHAGRTYKGLADSGIAGYFAGSAALATYIRAFTLAVTAEAITVAVAIVTVVIYLAVTVGTFQLTLVTAGGTVEHRLFKCARPKSLDRDEHRQHRYEQHRRGDDNYGFLSKLHFWVLFFCLWFDKR